MAKDHAPADGEREVADLELARDLLPASGTMIGVCTTLVGLVKIMERQAGPSHVDEYCACIGVAFLLSAASAYLALRLARHKPALSLRCERAADFAFLAGLASLVGLVALFAFETI